MLLLPFLSLPQQVEELSSQSKAAGEAQAQAQQYNAQLQQYNSRMQGELQVREEMWQGLLHQLAAWQRT